MEESSEANIGSALSNLLATQIKKATPTGHVIFAGAGSGDPELLTLKAGKALGREEVMLYDCLVSNQILELARREGLLIDVGKTGFEASTPQQEINALLLKHSQNGDVIHLNAKGGVYTGAFKRQNISRKTDAQAALNAATAQASHVMGAYLANFIDENAGPKPAHFREVFRTEGLGNYFYGKQTEKKSISITGLTPPS